jgi:AraC-like DNA-binding protein
VGVIDRSNPQQDELLAAHGWTPAVLNRWLAGGKDKLRDAAIKEGLVCGYPGQKAGSPLVKTGHSVVVMLPENLSEGRWWWMMLTRDRKAFNAVEQEKATHLLRRLQNRFSMPYEIQLSRLIVGHDDRLIATDLDMSDRILDKPAIYDELLTTFHRVVDQRYPKLNDFQTHDMAIQLGRKSYWLNFTRRRTIPGADTYHWYIELRPLGDDEIPVVGTVKDDRVAKALAYLHDNFSDVPSLATLAKQTSMSQFHFHRLFSAQVGTSPKQYLLRKQLQMAKWMLRAQPIPIGEIAQLTGFSSHGHFTSTFHRMIGVSPTEYRESFY